jgi:hypothetical protein
VAPSAPGGGTSAGPLFQSGSDAPRAPRMRRRHCHGEWQTQRARRTSNSLIQGPFAGRAAGASQIAILDAALEPCEAVPPPTSSTLARKPET